DAAERLDESVDRIVERIRFGEQRAEVLELDAGCRKVRHVTNVAGEIHHVFPSELAARTGARHDPMKIPNNDNATPIQSVAAVGRANRITSNTNDRAGCNSSSRPISDAGNCGIARAISTQPSTWPNRPRPSSDPIVCTSGSAKLSPSANTATASTRAHSSELTHSTWAGASVMRPPRCAWR